MPSVPPLPAAMLFDMDGVILDTEPIHWQAFRYAGAQIGYDFDEPLLLGFIGRTTADNRRDIIARFGEDFPFEALWGHWHRYWQAHVGQHGIPHKPGLAELLDTLDTLGIRKAIATSSHRAEALHNLGRLADRFETITTGDQVAHGKPAPDIYLRAARTLSLAPAACWVIEDSEAGVRAAHAAGTTPLMVPDLKPPSDEVARLAWRVLPSLHHVPPLLQTAMRITLLLLTLVTGFAQAQSLPAETVLARTLAFHDPRQAWSHTAHHITLRETRPGAPDRQTTVGLRHDRFTLASLREGHQVQASLRTDGTCTASVDGQTALPDSMRQRYMLSCTDQAWLRGYYGYLLGLPMKLHDPGTHLDPEARRTTFRGRAVYALRVTYDPTVGHDTWYFYVDPDTFALVGCRFYHDEAADDGEHLVFSGWVEAEGLRLPRVRQWYMNQDDAFLGADFIENYRRGE